jgi:hypothetical protein
MALFNMENHWVISYQACKIVYSVWQCMLEKVLDTVKTMQMEITYIYIFITAVFPLPASARATTPLFSYASMQAIFLHTQVPWECDGSHMALYCTLWLSQAGAKIGA